MGRHRALTIETHDEIKERLAAGESQRALAKEKSLSTATLCKIESGEWFRGYAAEQEHEEVKRQQDLAKQRGRELKGTSLCENCGVNVSQPCVACKAKKYIRAKGRRRRTDKTLHCVLQERPDRSIIEIVEQAEDPLDLRLSTEQQDRLVEIRCRGAFHLSTLEGD